MLIWGQLLINERPQRFHLTVKTEFFLREAVNCRHTVSMIPINQQELLLWVTFDILDILAVLVVILVSSVLVLQDKGRWQGPRLLSVHA